MSERTELLEANLLEVGDRIVTPTGVKTIRRIERRSYAIWIKWEGEDRLTRVLGTDRFETIERN